MEFEWTPQSDDNTEEKLNERSKRIEIANDAIKMFLWNAKVKKVAEEIIRGLWKALEDKENKEKKD